MTANNYGHGPGIAAPERLSEQALMAINGGTKAAEYLARLQAQQADPDEELGECAAPLARHGNNPTGLDGRERLEHGRDKRQWWAIPDSNR